MWTSRPETNHFSGNGPRGEGSENFPSSIENLTTADRGVSNPARVGRISDIRPVWAQHFWIDSASIGDVLGGRWGAFLRTRGPIVLTTVGYPTGMAMATKYTEIEEEAAPDPIGTEAKYDIPYSTGLAQEIAISDQGRRYRLMIR